MKRRYPPPTPLGVKTPKTIRSTAANIKNKKQKMPIAYGSG
jgi:hypothetical protein